MSSKQKKIDQHVIKLLEKAGVTGDDLTKYLIMWKQFYLEIKPNIQRLTADEVIGFSEKFLLFMVQFESICARAFRPLSGSQSVAREIISMYSARHLDLETGPVAREKPKNDMGVKKVKGTLNTGSSTMENKKESVDLQ